eukprot:1100094-Karenia_brevis.AAC.1
MLGKAANLDQPQGRHGGAQVVITPENLEQYLASSRSIKSLQGDVASVNTKVSSMQDEQRMGFKNLERLLQSRGDGNGSESTPDLVADNPKLVTDLMHDNFMKAAGINPESPLMMKAKPAPGAPMNVGTWWPKVFPCKRLATWKQTLVSLGAANLVAAEVSDKSEVWELISTILDK